MSSGVHVMPHLSWEVVVSLLGALGLGGVITALVQRPSRRAVDASANRDEAMGEAAVIASIATAFTGTTGALREEIERMQTMLNELRTRVVEAEAELRAAAAREVGLDQLVADLRAQLEAALADVARLRGERDAITEKTVQQEGEIRQLKAVIEATTRVGAVQ